MENKQIINYGKALEEKKAMQEVFIRDNGYSSSMLSLLILHFEKEKEKR